MENDERNMPFRPYPARKSDVDQGYESVPMNGDRKHFKPSVADVRTGQASPWQVEYGEWPVEIEPTSTDD